MKKLALWQVLLTLGIFVAFASFTVPAQASPTCIQPPAGMVSWWPGDGNANDIIDGNPGTLQNGATFATGNVGQAFSLDGVDDFVAGTSPGTGFPISSSARTIDAWVKTTATTADRNIFHYGIDGSTPAGANFHLYLVSGIPCVGNGYGFGVVCGSTSVADGTFHYVAGVYEGPGTNIARVYVDGLEVGSGTLSTVPNTGTGTNWRIGLFMPGGTPFSGIIDEVEIYNRALSASEIQAIFNAGSAGKCKLPSLAITLTGCTTCRAGDQFTVQAHVTNPNSRDVPVEAKVGVRLPDGIPINLLGDKHLEVPLSAGLDTTFTLFDFPLPDGLPTGTWSLEGTLLGPELGETFSRDVKAFDVVP